MATIDRIRRLEQQFAPVQSLAYIITAARHQLPQLSTREALEETARTAPPGSLRHKVAKARLRACLYAAEGEKQ